VTLLDWGHHQKTFFPNSAASLSYTQHGGLPEALCYVLATVPEFSTETRLCHTLTRGKWRHLRAFRAGT